MSTEITTHTIKKILFIIPSLVGGGAERVLINLLNKLNFSKYEITLCVVNNEGVYFEEVPKKVQVITLFNNYYIERLVFYLHKKFAFSYFLNQIIRSKINGNYDVGISFIDSHYTDILFSLDKKISKKISWVHSSYNTYSNFKNQFKGNYKNRVINNRYKKLDKIVFVSNDSKSSFFEIFGSDYDTQVLYNLMDKESVLAKANQPLDISFDSDKINIVAVGSYYPVKGYDKLIDAAHLLKKDNLNFHIKILGKGFLEEEHQKQIESLGLESHVKLEGFKSNPYAYIKNGDIFIMTSISEALPTALIEAMIIGKPVQVTNCSGCREVVDYGEFGMMVEQSAEDIYNGLKKLITDETLRKHFEKKSIERSAIFNDANVLKSFYHLVDTI